MSTLQYSITATVMVALLGCSGAKDPSESNFRKAIDDKLANNPICISIPQADTKYYIQRAGGDCCGDDPNTILLKQLRTFSEEDNKITGDLFADLEKASLITKLTDNFAEPGLFSMPYGVYMVYHETRSKLPAPTPSKNKNDDPSLKFCIGTLSVDKIIEWSEPGDLLGKKVTEVKYTTKLVNTPNWASSVLSNYDTSKERKAALILTNKGWSAD